MNPPYQRNLHLKILAEAIKHLNDEDSKVVNLSPIRWLEDPLASYKKNNDYHRFEDKVGKHIEDAEIISQYKAQELFEAIFNYNLGVYCCDGKEHTIYQELSKDSILNKTIPYLVLHNPVFERNKQEGWRLRMPDIATTGGSGKRIPKLNTLGKLLVFKDGKYKDGKWWYDCYQRTSSTKTTPYITNSIAFEDEETANNFIKQYDTYFAKYITDKVLSGVNVTPKLVLWMADAINPRTGKKGYESDWTDEDFCKFFDITEEEYEHIVQQATRYDKNKSRKLKK